MSQLDDKLNSVISLKRKIKPGKGEGQNTLRTPYSCTRYTAITQKYKLGISSNIFMYISLCPPEWENKCKISGAKVGCEDRGCSSGRESIGIKNSDVLRQPKDHLGGYSC